ncbi:hypothetical protein PS2_007508 [Malus domestica]
MLIRKPGPVNSHNFFHEKGGTAVDSSSTASSKIRIFSRASNATSSSSSHVDDDSDRECGCSRRLASSSSAPSCSFDDSSSCSRNWALMITVSQLPCVFFFVFLVVVNCWR